MRATRLAAQPCTVGAEQHRREGDCHENSLLHAIYPITARLPRYFLIF